MLRTAMRMNSRAAALREARQRFLRLQELDFQTRVARQQELALIREVAAARNALREIQERERKIMRLATQPWLVVSRGKHLDLTATSLRRGVSQAVRLIVDKGERARVQARLRKLGEEHYRFGAARNRHVRLAIVEALVYSPKKTKAPVSSPVDIVGHLRMCGCFPAADLVTKAGCQRLLSAVDAADRARRTTARMRRQWSLLTSAFATGSTVDHRRASGAIQSVADRIAGFKKKSAKTNKKKKETRRRIVAKRR